ncbi:MAG: hypothetical protein PVG65_03250 [Candidatus Thorarchaeota archaeon]
MRAFALRIMTLDVYKYGSVRPLSDWPPWIRVTHLYHSEGDSLTVEFTVHIDIDRTFLDAEATMTVRAVGCTYTPFYQPFDCTYCVSCSAYIDYY